jgi:flagellin-like protein
MKGVSAIIAIILILMIVVALAALAYTWFTGIFASLTGTAGTAIETTTGQMATQFRLEAASWNTGTGTLEFTIRNTGAEGAIFDPTQTSLYLDGNFEPITVAPSYSSPACSTTFDKGCTITWKQVPVAYTGMSCTTPKTVVKVSIATGLSDSKTVECV